MGRQPLNSSAERIASLETSLWSIKDNLERNEETLDAVASKLPELRESFEARTDAEIERAEERLRTEIGKLIEVQKRFDETMTYWGRWMIGCMVSAIGALVITLAKSFL